MLNKIEPFLDYERISHTDNNIRQAFHKSYEYVNNDFKNYIINY